MVRWEATAIRQRQEERRLASVAHTFIARSRWCDYGRSSYGRAWWVVITAPLGALVFSSCAPPSSLVREFALGIILTSGVWGSIMVVVTLSGTTPRSMGKIGEEWTAHGAKAAGRGWYLANGLFSDLD